MTTTLSYISLREDEGDKAAVLFKKYKLDTERPLAAILSLNTIANTVGSVGIGMQATLVFGNKWVGLTSAIVTLLILIFAEIIPKTIGTTYWKSLMTFTAYTTRALIVIMFPFVLLVHYLTRMFHKEDTVGDNTVSREEVSAMANVGEEEGVIEKDENKIIQNIIRLDDIKAFEVMTTISRVYPSMPKVRSSSPATCCVTTRWRIWRKTTSIPSSVTSSVRCRISMRIHQSPTSLMPCSSRRARSHW